MAIEHIFNKDPVPLYIGFEDIDSDLRSANEELYKEEFNPTHFPLHNIYTKDGKYYVVMHIPGFKKEDVEVKITGDLMSASGKRVDVYSDAKVVYAGLNSPADFIKMYRLADDLDLESISYEDGVLTVVLFKVVVKDRAGEYKVNYSKGNPKPAKVETTGAAGSLVGPAIISGANVELPKPTLVDSPDVVVTLPAVLPQIVEVSTETVGETPSIVVKDASVEVKDNTELVVVKTEEGKSDVIVSIPEAVKDQLAEAGVNVETAVENAIKEVGVAPELPKESNSSVTDVMVTTVNNEPKIEVTVPDTITQVMEVTKDDNHESGVPSITLSDTSEQVSPTAELVPVVTPEGQPDVVVAIEPEVKKELETAGVNVAEDVGKAIELQTPTVETVTPVVVPASLPEVVAADPVVVEVTPPKPEEVAPVAINANDATKPTVEVTTLDPMPQIVSVETTTPVNADTDVAVVLKDATHEVADNVELIPVATAEGKSDVVIAVTPEVKAEMIEKKVDLPEVVSKAIAEAEVTPVLPETEVKVNTSVVVSNNENNQAIAEVSIPAEPTQVMEVKVENTDNIIPKLVVSDVSEKIPENAVLTPVVTPEGQPDVVIAVTPEVKEILDTKGVDAASAVTEAMNKLDSEVTTIVDPVHSSVEEVPKTDVEVVPLEPMPQVVTVEMNPASTNSETPSVVLKDATVEVKDNVELIPVATTEGKSDVVVAIEPEVKKELETAGVNVAEAVAETTKKVGEPELPVVSSENNIQVNVETSSGEPKLNVIMPESVTTIMKLEPAMDSANTSVPEIILSDTSASIPANSELIAVETKEGQPDIVVAVDPEHKSELEAAGVDIAKDVSAAVVSANVEVITTVATEVK